VAIGGVDSKPGELSKKNEPKKTASEEGKVTKHGTSSRVSGEGERQIKT